MATYFDRYGLFIDGNKIKPIPGIIIPNAPTDRIIYYKQTIDRLDKISNSFYNNAYSGWLIMLANPEFGGLEFNIPDMTPIRVPFPYSDAINRYLNAVKNHISLYGE